MANHKLLLKKMTQSLGLYPAARLALAYSLRVYPVTFIRRLVDRNSAPYHVTLSFFRQLIGENDLVFDIGANCGGLTEVFLDLGARVVACEPQPDCFRELMARHANRRRFIATNDALGAKRGEAKLYVRGGRVNSGLVENWHPDLGVEKVLDVKVVTLDDLIDRYGIPKYCKIDVEGYEYEVLQGLTKTIPIISLETRQTNVEKTMGCLDYLSRFGSLSINVSPIENYGFLFSRWVSQEYFLEFLTTYMSNLSDFYYGDIFVKIQSPMC